MENLVKQLTDFIPILLKGANYTVQITVTAIILSTVWGFILSLGLRSGKRWI